MFMLLFVFLSCAVSLRLGSYNIRAGVNMTDIFDLKGTGHAIKLLEVDLIGLQEVDNKTDRHDYDEPALLAEYSGMPHYYFAGFRNFEHGYYGVSILSRKPVLDTKILRYKNKTAEECAVGKDNDFCQGALAVEYGPNKWFITTHLGIGRGGVDVQAEEAGILLEWIEEEMPDASHIYITGDFNTIPDTKTHEVMTAKMDDLWLVCGKGDGYSFPADKPDRRIDYIYSTKDIGCDTIEVFNTQASDHRPVHVVIA